MKEYHVLKNTFRVIEVLHKTKARGFQLLEKGDIFFIEVKLLGQWHKTMHVIVGTPTDDSYVVLRKNDLTMTQLVNCLSCFRLEEISK